jgi:hypothetical protein
VVSIGGDVTQIIYALDAQPQLVARDSTSLRPISCHCSRRAQGLDLLAPAFLFRRAFTTLPVQLGDFVTSLELFAADGTQIAQLYGQRSEGTPEQKRWREPGPPSDAG